MTVTTEQPPVELIDQIRNYLEENCVRETKNREMLAPVRLRHLPSHMPEILTWDHEPEARMGDEFVFAWKKIHHTIDGRLHTIDVPHIYIRLTSNPKRRRTLKGYEWRASYCWCEMESYMAPGAGTVTDPRRSIDPERPLAPVGGKSVEVRRAEEAVRKSKRQKPRKKDRDRDRMRWAA